MDATDVSIVLCVYKPGNLLAQALGCLATQDARGAFSFEILVVDDEPADLTARFVTEFAKAAPASVRYVATQGRGVSHARNVGIRESRAAWIAWFDQDQTAGPDWLYELYRVARETGADWVDGPRDLLLDDATTAGLNPFMRACLGVIRERCEVHRVTRRYASCTGNALARKTALETTGPFDETIQDGWEDWDYVRRFRNKAFDCWYAPAALVHHVVPPERLARSFYRWHARRIGAAFASRDAREWGMCRTMLAAAARLAQAALVHAPWWALARLRRDKNESLTRECLILRALSYVRKTLYLVSPRLFPQASYHARLRLRSEPKYAGRPDP